MTLLEALQESPGHLTLYDARGANPERRPLAELGRSDARAGAIELVALPTSWAWFDAWVGALQCGARPVAMAPASGFGGATAHASRVEQMRERLTGASGGGGAGAYGQLTSGSTGHPRTVWVTDEAVLHNIRAIDAAIDEPDARTVVSWLPMHHDMGLVGCFLFAALTGRDLVLYPPAAFLRRPRLWLEEIQRHDGVLSPAPNFGFQYCVERVAERPDLTPWRAAMVGAEMIRPQTVHEFCETFQLAPEVIRPCYGLAEATLSATLDTAKRGLRLHDGHVCVGAPVRDTHVKVENGDVFVRGAAVCGEGWLDTGDVGFLFDGELYLTGRRKEILILRGINVMPQEVEWIAEAVTGGGGAARAGAFSVDAGTGEACVLVVEGDGAAEAEIRRRIGRELGIVPHDLRFVRRGAIPRTTSGKLKRAELRSLYLDGEL